MLEFSSARPYAYRFQPETTALVMIDMQRDFLDRGGYGELQCADKRIFERVRSVVPMARAALDSARELGLHIIHTREGHRSDLKDLPAGKRLRQKAAPSGQHPIGIGDQGPIGRVLVRGEYGHDIIDELKPVAGELVIDKPGKGSFWNTSLHRALLARGVTHLVIAGVTTECCVNATFREASDRGYECCVLSDCTSGFASSFVETTLEMLCSFDGLYGFVCNSTELKQHASEHQVPNGFADANLDLSLSVLQRRYRRDPSQVVRVAEHVAKCITEYDKVDPAVWIFKRSEEDLVRAALEVDERYRGQPLPPLYGVPFAVKDNTDVEGFVTTAACEKKSYTPKASAKVVRDLIEAGALFVGKTNMDQLAAGLSGCRSPFGYPRSVFDSERISGGSSSGSAVAVAAGLVSFALGTDTAGSGRVPAALNGVVGFKPTKGTLSADGVVPACRSLDTISIFSKTVHDARSVWIAADSGPDVTDSYAKSEQSLPLWHVDFRGLKAAGFIFGVPPPEVLSICTSVYREHFEAASSRLIRAGGTPVVVDWTPFATATRLLYDGALMNERVHSAGVEFLQQHEQDLLPTTRSLFRGAMTRNAAPWDVFRDQQCQAECTRQAALEFENIDVLLVPPAIQAWTKCWRILWA